MVLSLPISLGTIAKLEQEMSAALAPAPQAVQEVAVKNVDESRTDQGCSGRRQDAHRR